MLHGPLNRSSRNERSVANATLRAAPDPTTCTMPGARIQVLWFSQSNKRARLLLRAQLGTTIPRARSPCPKPETRSPKQIQMLNTKMLKAFLRGRVLIISGVVLCICFSLRVSDFGFARFNISGARKKFPVAPAHRKPSLAGGKPSMLSPQYDQRRGIAGLSRTTIPGGGA